MYPRQRQDQHSLHHPRPRQPSSTTSSTLLASSTSGSEAWMPPTRASTSTSRSIFSETDNETEGRKYEYEETEMGTVVDHDRPLIDLDDDPTSKSLAPTPQQVVSNTGHGATPTPGEKLRLLLKQMEAEVRDTTPAPPPPQTIYQQRRSSASSDDHALRESTHSRSNWREGRRIGALPKERKYTPPSSPERQHQDPPRHSEEEDQEDQEEQEILDDSPPTPPLRITNPYLYASRKVSDERRSSTSPRQPSRAAVLHASTSRSPPSDPAPSNPTPLQSYLARAPSSPSRKGKERATTPTPAAPSPARIRKPTRTPRKWSIELAPDDSVLFAEGLEDQADQEMELDLDESADPPWGWESESGAGSSDAGDGSASDLDEGKRGVGSSVNDQTARQQHQKQHQRNPSRNRDSREDSLPELPALPIADHDAEAESTDESPDESMHPPPVRPPSRSRSRFSQSPSLRRSQSPSFTTAKSISPSKSHDNSSSFNRRRTLHFEPTPPTSPSRVADPTSPSQSRDETSTSTSFTRRNKKPPPVEPILTPEPVKITPATPPKQIIKTAQPSPIPAQTPRPPGAWYSASKPRPNPNVRFSPLRHGHIPPPSDSSASVSASGDVSIHRLILSPSKRSPNRSPTKTESAFHGGEDVGETSFTRRLVQGMTKTLTRSSPPAPLPAPSSTLAEAQLALKRAAEASALARRKVEYSQRQWLEALSMARNGTAEVIKHGWTWTRWVWWISIELMLLWGVFRVTMEYASPTQHRLLDPSSAPSFALSIPLPSAVSAFVIPQGNRRGSANFFDLLEQLEVWKYLDMAGTGLAGDGEGNGDVGPWMRKVVVRVPI